MERWKGMLYLLGAFSLAGTSVITGWFLNERLGGFTITAVSLFFALLCLLPLCLRNLMKTVRRLSIREWRILFFQALFGMFLFRMFLLYGLQHTSSAEAGILTGATPAFTVILAGMLLKESMNRTKLVGVLSTVGGVIVIQGLFSSDLSFSIHHVWGNALVLCAAASESYFNILSRISSVKQNTTYHETIHPIVQTTLVSALALVLCLVPAWFENPAASLSAIGLKEWLALVWYGPIVTALAFICWYAGIKRCQASTAAAFSGMMPFTALMLSVILLKESAGWEQWCGGLLVIIGMILIGRNQAQTGKLSMQPVSDHGIISGVRNERMDIDGGKCRTDKIG